MFFQCRNTKHKLLIQFTLGTYLNPEEQRISIRITFSINLAI